MIRLAPIALFVYNRPLHTQKVIEALQSNTMAKDSNLFIFSDGAKAGEEEMVKKVRLLIRETQGFKSVKIIERENNYGLANSVIDGVSQLNKKYGSVIVFEDDVVSSPYTLKYFNDALTKYESTNKVMHIGGFMYAIDHNNLPETFFTRHVSSQAWATWDRAWQSFEPNIDKLIDAFDNEKKYAFELDGTMNFWKHIQEFKVGKNNSWAIRWYASVFLKEGLSLQTAISMVENIGHDGSGVHSEKSNIFSVEINPNPISYFPTEITENTKAFNAIKHFLKYRKGNLFQRAFRFINNRILK